VHGSLPRKLSISGHLVFVLAPTEWAMMFAAIYNPATCALRAVIVSFTVKTYFGVEC
jgi:hypothetical protein